MLVSSFITLATLLPALAALQPPSPPHLRHRNLIKSIRHINSDNDSVALLAGANDAHAAAHRAIKRTVNKRGQQCRVRPTTTSSSLSASSTTPTSVIAAIAATSTAPSSSIENQQAWAQKSSTSAPVSSTSAANSWSSPSSSISSGSGSGSNSGGLLTVTDSSCGYCNSNDQQPNGAESWLNCGINGAGWTPPHVTADQLVAADLDSSGVFSPCADYINLFQQYGGQYGIAPIMLASFAMQESTCNAGATGGNGEAGLMQIAPVNCEAGYNCWDPDYNVRRGAELFSQMISSNNGNVLAAIGSYNGWSLGMTYGDATAAASQGNCKAQNNLDYLYQFTNGWMQNKNAEGMGQYFNLAHC